jgi:hypothetical protein
MDINSTISDSTIPASTGFTNLTVYHESAAVHKPLNESVVDGKTHYLWDISSHNDNGTFTIEVYWTNGTEAGYNTTKVLVFYPTTLEADECKINAYTESSFDIRVIYNETFTPKGLNSSFATIEYSFDGEANVSMDNAFNNGTWTKTIFTDSRAPSTYNIEVFAKGYAIQNQSLIIIVNLIHETIPLNITWSNTDNITYNQKTNLTVQYQNATNVNIDGATVNVSINGGIPIVLNWDASSETYWIELNESDLPNIPATVTLNVSAWKAGYEAQFNDTITLTIREEITTITVTWEPADLKIDYVSKLNLTVDYEYSGGDVPTTAKVNVTINGQLTELTYSTGAWHASIPCSNLGVGIHDADIDAWLYGYEWRDNLTQGINITLAAASLKIIWSSTTLDYLGQFDLTVNYTYDRTAKSIPATPSNVNISIDGASATPLTKTNGLWIGNYSGLDLGSHNINISAWALGYEHEYNDTTVLFVTNVTTFIFVNWEPIDVEIDLISKLNITVDYNYTDGDVPNTASVNVSINGHLYELSYSSDAWRYSIPCSDIGTGVFNATVDAWLYGYFWKTNLTKNINITLAASTLEVFWSSTTIDYLGQIDLTVNYTYDRTGQPVPALTGHVNISIDGQIPLPLVEKNGVWIGNFTNANLSLGDNPVNISAWADKFTPRFNDIYVLTMNNASTTLEVIWEPIDVHLDVISKLNVTVKYNVSSTTDPVIGASVNLTIGGVLYTLEYSSETWTKSIDCTDIGVGVFTAYIDAWLYGYIWKNNQTDDINITLAATSLEVIWNIKSIDYLGKIDLTVNYTYDRTDQPVPVSEGHVNISIDGQIPLPLVEKNGVWIGNFTNANLSLGDNPVYISAWAQYYELRFNATNLFVDNVTTNALIVTWEPANVTIEFTDILNLAVDYTFDNIDITTAEVNVSINGLERDLTFSSGFWRVSIPGQLLGIGYYDAIISAWLYGYEHRTNITYGVNITLAANLFWVTWNPTDRNVTYIEDVSAAVNYTRDFIPVTAATVNLYLNGSGPYPLSYDPVDKRYHITRSASLIGLGVWNATITANKTGYEPQSAQSYLTVYQDIPIVVPSWTEETTDYVSPKTLTVSVTDSIGVDIDDAVFSVNVAGTNPDAIFISNGEYNITLGPFLALGIQEVNVTVTSIGYRKTTLLLTLNVTATETLGIFDRTNTTIFCDESVDLTISFQMLNSSYVQTENCSVKIEGISQSITWNVNHWETEFLGYELGLGIHHCTIEVTATGYVMQTDEFDITVNPIPTLVQLSENRSLYVNDTLQLFVTYYDSRTDTLIEPGIWSVSWLGTYDWSYITSGNYSLILNGTGIHVGSYTLETLLEKTGYENDTMQWEIQVLPVLVDVIISAPQETWENETITVSVRLNDTVHGVWIHWANVTLTLENQNFSMEYIPATHSYTKILWVNDTFSPDSYTLKISANAIDCEQVQGNHSILVNQKRTYYLSLTMPVNVTIGTPLVVQINVTDDISSSGISIYLIVYAEYIINETLDHREQKGATTTDGNAEVSFTVDELYDRIIVWAEFEGSIQEWPAEAISQSVGINPVTVLTPLEALIAFFSDTTVQMAIIGIILLGAIGASYIKIIKPRREAEEKVLERQLHTFNDLDAIRHFMAVYTTRGTCVYYHPFTDSRIQPDLISGFITAITSVYGEITGEDGVVGTLEEIQYHGLRLNSFSGRFIIGILISEGDMTDLMRDRLQFFVEMFELQYEVDLEDWVGVMDCFNPEWVVSNLNASFNYHWRLPHRLGNVEKGRKDFKNIMKIIESSLNENNEFLFVDLIEPIAERFNITQAEALELLLMLDDLNIIHPISVHTVLQRSGLGLPGEGEEVIEEPHYEEQPSEVEKELAEPKEEKPKKSKKQKKKKKVEEEQPVEPPPEEEEPVKEEEKFIAEVEKILSEEDKERSDTTEDKGPDELEQFVSDVEKLLSEEDDEKSDTSD